MYDKILVPHAGSVSRKTAECIDCPVLMMDMDKK